MLRNGQTLLVMAYGRVKGSGDLVIDHGSSCAGKSAPATFKDFFSISLQMAMDMIYLQMTRHEHSMISFNFLSEWIWC